MEELKILVFKLNNQMFAANIMDVERILGYEEPAEIPDSPAFLKGVIKYMDGVIPVIDLHEKFKIKNKLDVEQRIVVVKKEKGCFGLVVDDVNEVITVTLDKIKQPDSINEIISKTYIKGIVESKDELIIYIDLNSVLTINEEDLIFEGV